MINKVRSKILNISQRINTKRFFVIFMLICWGTLIIFQLGSVVKNSIKYDDAYNASVAKNFIKGPGYATTYDKVIFFNPEITTGPTLIIPTSLLILIFGNQYWVPGLTTVIVINFLLVLMFCLKGWASVKVRSIVTLGFILVLLLFNVESSLFALVGEVPSILLSIICVILISQFPSHSKFAFLSGIFSGLASLTKLMAITTLPVIILFIGVGYRKNVFKNYGFKEVIAYSLKAIFGFVLVWIPYLLGIFLTLYNSYLGNINGEVATNFLSQPGSGFQLILESKNILATLKTNTVIAVKSFINYFGNPVASIILGVLFIAVTIFVFKRFFRSNGFSRETALQNTAFGLVILGWIYVIWWIFISAQGWIRHLYPAIMFFLFALIVCLVTNISRIVKSYLMGLFILFLAFSNIISTSAFTSYFAAKSDRINALNETSNKISELKQKNPNAVFVGCGWWANRDLEYILFSSLNFRNCTNLEGSELNSENIYLVRSEYYNFEHADLYTKFAEKCDRNIIFKRSSFIISRCSF